MVQKLYFVISVVMVQAMYVFIFFLVGLQSIDPVLYEAAP